jgi:hypothetical protein
MEKMNWNTENIITPAMGGERYNTKMLIELFTYLQKQGYSGLSLGLIIDLIRQEGAN